MVVRNTFLRLVLIAAAILSATAGAITSWTITIPTATTGSFSASESTTSSTVTGTYTRQSNGFIQMTVTGGSGATRPSDGTVKYAIEIPGFMLASQPMLTDEKRIITTVSTGSCPTSAFTGILGYSIWAGTAGTSYDVSNAAVPAFGVFTWDPATNLATISDLRNLTSYATLGGFASFNLAGSCTNGVITFSGAGDRGGTLYITNTNGGLYVTNTNRAIMILPQVAIPAASILNGTYAVWDYDESAHTNIYGSRITIASGTTGTGDRLSDMGTGTADTTNSWTMSSISINTPINGVFTTDVTLEGGSTRKCACAVYLRNKTTIFCVAQLPTSATRPMNFIMASDNQPYAGGTLDTYGFGTGIKVNTFAGGADRFNGIALQSDGKIVGAGYDRNDFGAMRFLADGSLDTSFSSDGKVVTNVLAGATDRGQSVAVDSLGRAVVVGYEVSATAGDNFAAVRYASDGTLDTAFSTDGIETYTITTAADRALGVAIDSSNRVVIAGYTNNGTDTDFAVARLTTAGALDVAFSTDGYDIQNLGGSGADQAAAVAIQSDGKIVATGYNNGNFATLRYATDGTLDANFSGDGIAYGNFGGTDRANAIALQNDGKIVTAGYSTISAIDESTIARYLSDGSLDTSFSTDGYTIQSISTTADDRFEAVAVTTDGKIIAAGWVNDGTSDNIAIVKYASDGSLDTSFDTDGIYTYDHAAGADRAQAIAIQADGKVVIAGYATNTNNDAILLRLWP